MTARDLIFTPQAGLPQAITGHSGNIILIGPMGAGKSTIGRQLAHLLHWPFLDSDHEIERRTGADIPLIFEIEGEEGFRRREARLIAELASRQHIVLATGGGAVLREENRQAMRAGGTVIYLCADVDTLFARTRRDRNRPLLQTPDPRGRIEELLRTRDPLYRETAHHVVMTGRRPASAVVREIATILNVHHEDTPA